MSEQHTTQQEQTMSEQPSGWSPQSLVECVLESVGPRVLRDYFSEPSLRNRVLEILKGIDYSSDSLEADLRARFHAAITIAYSEHLLMEDLEGGLTLNRLFESGRLSLPELTGFAKRFFDEVLVPHGIKELDPITTIICQKAEQLMDARPDQQEDFLSQCVKDWGRDPGFSVLNHALTIARHRAAGRAS